MKSPISINVSALDLSSALASSPQSSVSSDNSVSSQQPLDQQQEHQQTPTSNSGSGKRSRPKKYQCPFCWVALSNSGQFKGHMRIHTGERPFRCDHAFCEKTFTRNEELTRHKRIHTGERPYACSQCNKSFGRKDHLKKHSRTHERHSAYMQQHHHHQHLAAALGAEPPAIARGNQEQARDQEQDFVDPVSDFHVAEQAGQIPLARGDLLLDSNKQPLCIAPLQVGTTSENQQRQQMSPTSSSSCSLGRWSTPPTNYSSSSSSTISSAGTQSNAVTTNGISSCPNSLLQASHNYAQQAYLSAAQQGSSLHAFMPNFNQATAAAAAAAAALANCQSGLLQTQQQQQHQSYMQSLARHFQWHQQENAAPLNQHQHLLNLAQQQQQLPTWCNLVSPEQMDLLYRLTAVSGAPT